MKQINEDIFFVPNISLCWELLQKKKLKWSNFKNIHERQYNKIRLHAHQIGRNQSLMKTDVEKDTISWRHCELLTRVWIGASTWESNLQYLEMLKIHISYNLVVPLPHKTIAPLSLVLGPAAWIPPGNLMQMQNLRPLLKPTVSEFSC